ncbi:MAG: hypothetical protein ACR2PS_02990 [Pseudomonadales bacterium]
MSLNPFYKPVVRVIAGLLFLLAQEAASDVPVEKANSTLGTAEQRYLEGLALRILESPVVRRQREMSRKVYETDPLVRTDAGRATLNAALDSISMAMLQWAVNDDSSRPKLFWVTTAAHAWMGREFPNSGYGIENPDNIYRHAPIDGHSQYEIRGIMPENPPAQQSFTLYATLPGMREMNREGSMILGALDRVVTEPDGSFVVTIDREAAAGRPNHIQSAEETALLIVRDSLTDWRLQSPATLSIHRVGGPQPDPVHDERYMAERAAWLIERAVPFWANYNNELIYTHPVNTVRTPRPRGGGWGYGITGHFNLSDEQALVVTLDPKGSGYLGFQLADPWGVGLEYVNRSGSLSAAQARANDDGTITYVISRRDPGVHNWLDTSGLDRGIFAIRWQDVPKHVDSSDGLVREVKLVPLSALLASLTAGTPTVDSIERARQLEERRVNFERRLRE